MGFSFHKSSERDALRKPATTPGRGVRLGSGEGRQCTAPRVRSTTMLYGHHTRRLTIPHVAAYIPFCPPTSRSGEIGIRSRLKICRAQAHVGSSPTSGIPPFSSGLTNMLRQSDKFVRRVAGERRRKPRTA